MSAITLLWFRWLEAGLLFYSSMDYCVVAGWGIMATGTGTSCTAGHVVLPAPTKALLFAPRLLELGTILVCLVPLRPRALVG